MRAWMLVLAVALVIAGCGQPHYAKFSSAKGKAYEIERDTCGKRPLNILTGQLDLPADASTQEAKTRIAQKVAERYMGPIKGGAYQGCLDGWRSEAPKGASPHVGRTLTRTLSTIRWYRDLRLCAGTDARRRRDPGAGSTGRPWHPGTWRTARRMGGRYDALS